ncbi:MAG TPA: flagellar assembly protein A [bacterium]
MSEPTPERRVRLVSQGYNSWRVQVLFPDTELSAGEISDRLREVKQELASQFGIPDAMLEYKQLLSKQVTRHGLLVQMQITKQDVPSGAPVFRALPLQLEDGTLFSDMRIEATFFPYDEFERTLTRQAVEVHLKSGGFDTGCINWDTVTQILLEMEERLCPVKGVEIGRGTPPGVGQSSRLTYGVPAYQEQFLTSAWVGTRPVVRGEFLAEASTSTAGHKWGRNVFGRELEPCPGISTRLVAGTGVKLVARETQLMALQDGLLVLERAGHDRRSRDTCDLIPLKLTASVLPLSTIQTTEVLNLDLTEPTAIFGSVEPGSRIRSKAPLYIEGNVGEGAVIKCSKSLRISGSATKANITSGYHLCINGDARACTLHAEYTLQVEGWVADSALSGMDVIVNEIIGGSVDALRQTSIQHTNDTGGMAATIRINLNKYLSNRQATGQEVLVELRDYMQQIVDLFGPEIAAGVKEGTAQRQMLKWLQQQKAAGAPNYTHAEMQELRTVMEMIPQIQEQVKAIGAELRDITTQLAQETSKADAGSTEAN